jgi:NADH:ubiquinone oxidoreductase subunit 6 (subunit J)
VLLIGGPTSPITDQGTVLLVYLAGGLMLAAALAVVLVRSALQAVVALSATSLLAAILFFLISDALLGLVQLLVYAVVAMPLLYLAVKETYGLGWTSSGFSSQNLIYAGSTGIVLLLLLGGVALRASWPAAAAASSGSLWDGLTRLYVVPLATIAVMILSAAVGAGLLRAKLPRRTTGTEPAGPRDKRRRA